MSRKPLTLKALGHVEKGFRLSDSYANSKTHYKVVEEYVIGYYFAGDGVRSNVRIAPIYRATIWIREENLNSAIASYEVGAYLNQPWQVDENVGLEHVGNLMAATANTAIRGLEVLIKEREAVANERKARERKARERKAR